MKLSFRSYPILEKIYKKSIIGNDGAMPICREDKKFFDENKKEFFEVWSQLCPNFQKEINYVSDPFLDAFTEEESKMVTLINSTNTFDVNDPRNVVNGTFIIEKDNVITVSLMQKNDSLNCDLYMFNRDGVPRIFIKIRDNIIIKKWYSNTYPYPDTDFPQVVSFIWALAVFKKFANVETIFVEPFSKNKSDGLKKVNDTKLKICYLDSRWYRNIVRTEGFSVRGHFRFQPFGTGLSKVKCIYINEFQKTGYTLHARKETTL